MVAISSKLQLRTQIRAQRQTLATEQREQAANQLAEHFVAHALFLRNQKFALYLPINGEMDTQPLLQQCFKNGKTCYLPIVDVEDAKQLCFVEFQENDILTVNRLGIKEPRHHTQKMISPENLQVVLLPLVAFDHSGNRLGMGAGYYDRTFAFLQKTATSAHRPLLMGVAYSFQEVEQLPNDAWDVPLDGVITELGVQLFAK